MGGLMPRLILASASPRRAELLRQTGFDFEVVPSQVEEKEVPGFAHREDDPAAWAERLALLKAEEVSKFYSPGEDVVVLGADTLVHVGGTSEAGALHGGQVLDKPSSSEDACQMLELLSGRIHHVITGVALVAPAATESRAAHEITAVHFRPLTPQEIQDYIATGEPLDKAGAYGVQERAARFVARIEGCYSNVVGLPVALVDRLLREWQDPRR
jgi:septum formation protein